MLLAFFNCVVGVSVNLFPPQIPSDPIILGLRDLEDSTLAKRLCYCSLTVDSTVHGVFVLTCLLGLVVTAIQ